MRKYLLTLAVLFCASTAHADFFIGLDLADAQSGEALDLQLGETQTLEIWVIGQQDQNIRAMNFDYNSDVAGIINASALSIDDLVGRWPINNNLDVATDNSASGLLIDDVSLATLGSFAGTGVTFTAAEPAVRLGTIDVSADAVGTANTLFTPGALGANDQDGAVTGFITGGRAFNVVSITAIPEPSSVIALSLVAGFGLVRRRRR